MTFHLSISRELNVDLWGTILNSKKHLRVFGNIYTPYENTKTNFVLRVDKNRPKKVKRPLSGFSLGKLDKAKFEAFYDLSPQKLRHLIKREKNLSGDLFSRLVFTLESQLYTILWRTQLFRHHSLIKPFIRSYNVAVNFKPINNSGLRIFPFDFIALQRFSPVELLYNISNNKVRLREHHLIISYHGFALVVFPIRESLFFFFPFDYSNIFYTNRY
jgi:ribosomal protein S4